MQSNSAVSFRSKGGMWEQLRSGKNITLWCDGMVSMSMSSRKKRKRPCESDLEEDIDEKKEKKSKKKKKDANREDKVEEELKAKHGKAYTPMQFRIWAEMIVGAEFILAKMSHHQPPCLTELGL